MSKGIALWNAPGVRPGRSPFPRVQTSLLHDGTERPSASWDVVAWLRSRIMRVEHVWFAAASANASFPWEGAKVSLIL
ncbi:hypothetical protein EMEDMD4_1100002 [Sinorhizobium medicae]|uniref:Uncharacterized protein n=1 Tax=Sinorhizobium medicae TaxID=110321 RepID=A0A508WQ47_9HYPH|nr:hypothetical protein EMEDMD4_1100002 [Sinorhizobium medicae]